MHQVRGVSTERPPITEADVDALASAIADAWYDHVDGGIGLGLRDQLAGHLLSSDWYAGVLEQARAAGRRSRDVDVDYRGQGGQIEPLKWISTPLPAAPPHEDDAE